MGDNFLEEQAKNSKKRRARTAAKRAMPKLIERPDEITDQFTIDCSEGEQLNAGDEIRCFPGQHGEPVDVALGHRHVGTVGEGGGEVLRRIVDRNGVESLRIISYCELTGTAIAEAINGK